jgi:hypothetical protein
MKADPLGVVVPNSNNPVQATEDSIRELESKMGTDEWYKHPEWQEQLQNLYKAQDASRR